MNRWIYLPIGLVVLGSGLLVYSWQRTPPPTPARASAAPSGQDIAKQVQDLKRELARLRSNTPSVVTIVERSPAPPVDLEAQAEPTATVEGREQSPQERSAAIATALDVRLASEPQDASWSQATNQQIREVMASNAPTAQVLDVECATSMCKVLLEHDAKTDQYEMALAVQATPPFSNGVYYHYESDLERPQTTLYVLREGRSFREDDSRAF